jgi:hypothetical protein
MAQYTDPFPVGIPTVSVPNMDINAYPNPVSDLLNVPFPSAIVNGQLILSDMQGKVVKRVNVNGTKTTLDVSDIDAGIYFLTLKDEKSMANSRISVVR